jgi:hypothetical protein
MQSIKYFFFNTTVSTKAEKGARNSSQARPYSYLVKVFKGLRASDTIVKMMVIPTRIVSTYFR